MEEKNLVKKENFNILEKIREFFKKKFCKEKNTENISVSTINRKNNIIDEMKKENELIILQRNYENGNIKEEELSEAKKEELLLLYKEQIINLETNIANYEKILEDYKNKIIEKRNKILENNENL